MRVFIYFIGVVVLALLMVAGGMAALGRWSWGDAGWYYPWNNSPEYHLRCGQKALRLFKLERARAVAARLRADGHLDQSLLLGGESNFFEAKAYAEANQFANAVPLFSAALDSFNKIRDQGAIRLEAATRIGQTCIYLKRPAEAEHALKFVLSQQPDNVEAHRGLAVLYYDQGAMSLTLAHLEKVAELDPQDGRPLRHMGFIYKDLEQYDKAVTCYEEALQRNLPGHNREQDPATVHMELAECLVKLARYTDASAVLQHCEPWPGDEATVAALRGECEFGMGQIDKARARLDEALEAHSDSQELIHIRAKILIQDNDLKRAAELLERALRMDQHDYVSRYLLQQTYAKLGLKAEAAEQERRLEQTKKDIEELAKLNREVLDNPWNRDKRLRLAEACDRLDKADLAAMWRQAAAACPAPQVLP